jgi:hypothetical protein
MQFIWETDHGTEIFAHYLFRGKYETPFVFDVWWEGFSGSDKTTKDCLKQIDSLFLIFKNYIQEYSNTY